MKINDDQTIEIYEIGDEQLSRLIKQAGKEARAKKKRALAHHYKKLKDVVAEGLACRQNDELPETTQ